MRKYLVGFLGLALISCSSDSTTAPTTVGESGSMSFSYTGAGGGGSYSAAGAVPASTQNQNTFGATAWAAALLALSSSTSIDVISAIPRSTTTWDLASVELGQQTIGTFQINTSTCTSVCNAVVVEFGMNANGSTFTYICTLTTGTITLTSKSSTRIVGSFSGSGTCITSTGVSSAHTITNGTFDVGIFTGTI